MNGMAAAGPDKVGRADERAKARDPHGTAPAGEAAKADPKGAPTPDRQDTEGAAKPTGKE